jgi:hypothetical protein
MNQIDRSFTLLGLFFSQSLGFGSSSLGDASRLLCLGALTLTLCEDCRLQMQRFVQQSKTRSRESGKNQYEKSII